MISFSRILVGVDLAQADRLVSEELADHCQNAVSMALQLAQAYGSEVTFITSINISEQALHLIEMHESPEISPVERDAGKVLQKLVDQAETLNVKANYVVAFGYSSEQIIKQAIRGEHTLLIIGGRGSQKLSHMLFGRTATKLLRKCPIPMLVARQGPHAKLESIMVADDFSDNGSQVLDAGVQLARTLETKLHIVHALEQTDDAKLVASGIPVEQIRRVQENVKEEANAKLAERLSRTDYRTLTQGTMTHIERGRAEDLIVEKLQEFEVDLLVMGTAGRSGWSALIIGNTAERLLSMVSCSLLVIKPSEFKSPIQPD